MKKLFLHIGTHKTGSTLIDHSLGDVQKELAKENISYFPELPLDFDLEQMKKFEQGIVDKSRKLMLDAVKKVPENNSLVVSFEGLAGDVRQGYQNVPFIAKALKEITEGFDVTIIVYLRRQDSFFESLYTQFIHMGGSLSFDELQKEYSESDFNWGLLVSSYEENFGKENLIVKRYEKQALPHKHSLLHEFADIIGSNTLKNAELPAVRNAGYDRTAVEIARLCTPHLNNEEKTILRRGILQVVSAKHAFGSYGYFSYEERKKFLDQYSKSNEKIAKEYFDGDKKLFSDPVDDGNEGYKLSSEDVARVLMLSIILLHKHTVKKDELATLIALRNIEKFVSKFPRLKASVRFILKKLKIL